jgi:hypothetical protein
MHVIVTKKVFRSSEAFAIAAQVEEIREFPPRPQQSICFSHNPFVNPKNLGLCFHLLPIENYTLIVLSDTGLLIIEI